MPLMSTSIGREVPEENYETSLPKRFEDQAVRVFCRHKEKAHIARLAFSEWCREHSKHMPFPASQQMDGDGEYADDDDAGIGSGIGSEAERGEWEEEPLL